MVSPAAQVRMADPDDPDTSALLLWGGGALTLLGFLAVLVATWASAWIGLLWALCLFAVGILAGFIFSISRVVENPAPSASNSTASVRYLPNTGLEQIADWLTKIIVGLALVELQKIPPQILAFSLVIAASIGDTAAIKGLAYAMIVFFPIMGFLTMYLATRIYLNSRIAKAEQGPVFSAAVVAAVETAPTGLPLSPNDATSGATAAVTATASDIANVPLTKLTTPSDVVSWARAQSVLAAWPAAVEGYKKAIQLSPVDPKLRLEFATALYSNGTSVAPVIEQLQAGLQLVDPQKDPEIAARLRESLILAYLYMPAPDGFTKAAELAESLINSPLPKRGVLYYYYACALGQKYAYLKKQPNPDDTALRQLHDAVLDAVRKALELDPSLVTQFRMVSDPTVRDKSKADDDLESFHNDADFQLLLTGAVPGPAQTQTTQT